jgi:hypothetical protein
LFLACRHAALLERDVADEGGCCLVLQRQVDSLRAHLGVINDAWDREKAASAQLRKTIADLREVGVENRIDIDHARQRVAIVEKTLESAEADNMRLRKEVRDAHNIVQRSYDVAAAYRQDAHLLKLEVERLRAEAAKRDQQR